MLDQEPPSAIDRQIAQLEPFKARPHACPVQQTVIPAYQPQCAPNALLHIRLLRQEFAQHLPLNVNAVPTVCPV